MKGKHKMYEIFEQLLQKNGLTAYKVSIETGIPQSTLSDWKRGRSTPKQDKMQKIADFFGVSLNYLMTGKDPEKHIDMDYVIHLSDPEIIQIVEVSRLNSDCKKRLMAYAQKLKELYDIEQDLDK